MEEKANFSYTANIKLGAGVFNPPEEVGEFRVLEMMPLTPVALKWQHKTSDGIFNGEGTVFVDFCKGAIYESNTKLHPALMKAALDIVNNKRAAAVDKSLILPEGTVEQMVSRRKQLNENKVQPPNVEEMVEKRNDSQQN